MAAFSPMTFPFCSLSCVQLSPPLLEGLGVVVTLLPLRTQKLLPICSHNCFSPRTGEWLPTLVLRLQGLRAASLGLGRSVTLKCLALHPQQFCSVAV